MKKQLTHIQQTNINNDSIYTPSKYALPVRIRPFFRWKSPLVIKDNEPHAKWVDTPSAGSSILI